MWMGKKYNCIVALLCWCACLHAQPSQSDALIQVPQTSATATNRTSTSFVVDNIYIEGNRKTKPYIIERELPFKSGDSIYLPDLVKGFDIARQQLINTSLFNDVIIA